METDDKVMTKEEAEKLANLIVGLAPKFADSALGVAVSRAGQLARLGPVGASGLSPARLQPNQLAYFGYGQYAIYRHAKL